MVFDVSAGAATATADDVLQPFQLDAFRVRGRVARLGPAIDRLLTCRPYPVEVAELLGGLATAAALLASSLKFDGVLTAQVKSDGPISLMVADFATPGAIRGYARFDAAAVTKAALAAESYARPVPTLLGTGHLAVTADHASTGKRYQGIVALEGAILDDCIGHYFEQSEQHRTFIRLATRTPTDDSAAAWRTGGFLMQQMPAFGGTDAADPADGFDPLAAWREALAFAATVRTAELIDPAIGPQRLLHRLFHEPGVRVYATSALEHRCRCRRERVRNVLASFERRDMEEMVVGGAVTVTCEFCNARYVFAPDELGLGADA